MSAAIELPELDTPGLFICNDSDPEWLERRAEGIGASEAACILGRSSFGGPAAVAARKLGYESNDAFDDENELLRWGKRTEVPLIEWFTEETGIPAKITGGMFRHGADGARFVQATLDGICVEDGKMGGVECKLARFTSDAWEKEGNVPDQYWIQIQQQMEVMDFDFSYALVLLDGYRPRYKRVERDRAFFNDVLFPAEEAFWAAIQSEEMVTPRGASAAEYAALNARYPAQQDGLTVRLEGDSYLEAYEDWVTHGSLARSHKKQQEEARNTLAFGLGEAETGVLDNGQVLTWRAQTRQEHVVKASTYRTLRAKKR